MNEDELDFNWSSSSRRKLLLGFMGAVKDAYRSRRIDVTVVYNKLGIEDKGLIDYHLWIDDMKEKSGKNDNSGKQTKDNALTPYLDDMGLHVTLANGKEYTVGIEKPDVGINFMFETLKIIFDYWGQKAKDGAVIVPRNVLEGGLDKKEIDYKSWDNLRTIVSRIRKRFEESKCSEIVSLGLYNESKNGYPFEINQPS